MDTYILRSEIYDVVKLSLGLDLLAFEAQGEAHSTIEVEGPSRNSPGFRKLIEGILYSRRFIWSYQLVLLALLVVFTILHWGSRFRSWWRRKYATKRIRKGGHKFQEALTKDCQGVPNKFEEAGSGASSSSATLQGSPHSPKALSIDVRASEQIPLLVKSKAAVPPSWVSSIRYKSRACLIYQPRPIPYINKTLPSNGTTLAVLALIVLQVFYSLWNVPLSLPLLFIFADRTSLVFVANLPLLYLFAAKNQPIKILTGYSYESLNIFHRRLGEVMCLLALLHSVGMIGVWYTVLRPSGFTLARFLLSKIILLGIGAFVAYETLYFTSLGSFRQRWYELFLGIHVTLQVIALVLVWFHHSTSRPYVAAALAIFLFDRLVYRMILNSRSLTASLKVKEDQKTVVLRATVPLSEKEFSFLSPVKSSIRNGWKATEHIFVTVPALSRKHIIQAHPFTIASRAPTGGGAEGDLKLIIRSQDGFSNDLLKYARGHGTANVRADGPYGSQTAVRMLKDSDISILVAGGSGIAVAWPLVWSSINNSRMQDLERSETNPPKGRVLLVWVVHSQAHLSWLEDGDLEELKTEGVDIIIPPPTAEHGHPPIKSLLTDWLMRHDQSKHHEQAKIGVVCSGPDGMNRDVTNMCSTWLRGGRDVSLEIEKFGW